MNGGAGMTSPHAIGLSGNLSVGESASYSFRRRYPGGGIGWAKPKAPSPRELSLPKAVTEGVLP